MLNVIIYEDNKNYLQKNINCINKALGMVDIDYRIHKFTKFNDELKSIINDKEMKKIYILDVEMEDISGLEVGAMIREVDFDSIIIFATAYDKYHNDVFYTRLMVLDFICKYDGYEERLIKDVEAALKILYREKTFVFQYNHVTYRIPYNHINYIEKEPFIKRCIIHTLENEFYIVKPINTLIETLEGNFYKTHQSCIVNVDNIKEIDYVSCVISFKNGDETDLLAEKKKKDLRNYVEVN